MWKGKGICHQQTNEIKRVMVIGGGVAGMEAARVATMRGHQVSLYEKSDTLGGHLLEASVPGFKKDVARLLRWYESNLADMNTEIFLNKEASPDVIMEEKPDTVIIATGSQPAFSDVQGIMKKRLLQQPIFFG
jgi:2-enoate reductase